MKFLIINYEYPDYLSWLYAQNPGLNNSIYDRQMKILNENLFGTTDFYSSNLKKLCQEALDIHVNNKYMQKSWMRDYYYNKSHQNLPDLKKKSDFDLKKFFEYFIQEIHHPHFLSTIANRAVKPKWYYDILELQIKYYEPDIIWVQDLYSINSTFLKRIKPSVSLVIGQHAASTLPDTLDLSAYDLLLSSFPPTIDYFRNKGIPAELHRLGFEPRILSNYTQICRDIKVSFIGSLQEIHSSRRKFLEDICNKNIPLKLWAPEKDMKQLNKKSPLINRYVGSAWGYQMYHIIHRSKITLNHHGDILPFANNMRLFEATGMGALLVTDWKKNISDIFEPDKEIITYKTPEECAEKIQYYLEHDEERVAIARAGQERTLKEHSYFHRMQELLEIIKKYQAA